MPEGSHLELLRKAYTAAKEEYDIRCKKVPILLSNTCVRLAKSEATGRAYMLFLYITLRSISVRERCTHALSIQHMHCMVSMQALPACKTHPSLMTYMQGFDDQADVLIENHRAYSLEVCTSICVCVCVYIYIYIYIYTYNMDTEYIYAT